MAMKRDGLSRKWIKAHGDDALAAYVAQQVELCSYDDGSYRICVNDIQWGRVETPSEVSAVSMANHAHEVAGNTLLALLRNAPHWNAVPAPVESAEEPYAEPPEYLSRIADALELSALQREWKQPTNNDNAASDLIRAASDVRVVLIEERCKQLVARMVK